MGPLHVPVGLVPALQMKEVQAEQVIHMLLWIELEKPGRRSSPYRVARYVLGSAGGAVGSECRLSPEPPSYPQKTASYPQGSGPFSVWLPKIWGVWAYRNRKSGDVDIVRGLWKGVETTCYIDAGAG